MAGGNIMDRKFIAANCKNCLRCLNVFGLWCAENMTPNGKGLVMCTALEECPYQKKYPEWFERQWHLRQSARAKESEANSDNEMTIW